MKTFVLSSVLFCLFLVAGSPASAHPVAQGALDLQIFSGNIRMQLRVSGEEVMVADTFSSGKNSGAKSIAEVWQRHGRYLLQHLKVFVDERRLSGDLVKVEAGQNDWVTYQFEFALPSAPSRLRVEEDVLNEIEFAPGNPWEASYVVRIHQQDRLAQEGILLSRRQPLVFACDWNSTTAAMAATAPLDRGRMVQQYVRHGIGHILSGYDHLLFVCALALGAITFLDLVKVVTAFTVAHTITLALSVLNIVRLPSHLVEPMIAGSIVFVAAANFLWPKRSRGWVRLVTAFFFGLFHGLGFAGGLLDAMDGMSGLTVGVAIAAFSLGVELGHQMVVLPLFFGLKLARNMQAEAPRREQLSLTMMRGGSLLISMAGLFYLVAALRQ